MLEDDLIPKPEFDEFGGQIVRPVVSSNDGFEMIVDNFDAWATYTKEARHPDAGTWRYQPSRATSEERHVAEYGKSADRWNRRP